MKQHVGGRVLVKKLNFLVSKHHIYDPKSETICHEHMTKSLKLLSYFLNISLLKHFHIVYN